MDGQSDDERIQSNVAEGFHGLLARIEASSLSQRPDVEGKIQVAFEVWQAGNGNLAVSLLLDILIGLRES